MRTESEIRKQERLIKQFLSEHPKYFTKYETMDIKSRLRDDVSDSFIPDTMRELLSYFDLLKEDEDIYQGFINLLKENFDINQNIIEVGGGVLPELAKKLSKQQQVGNITVYDPRLGTTETTIPNLSLIQEKFTLNTDVSNSGLIIAFMPCDGTSTVIEKATESNTDFMIAMCEGGPHGDYFDFYESDEEWIHATLCYAKNRVENNSMGKLQKTFLKKYHDPYPVIWNKRN